MAKSQAAVPLFQGDMPDAPIGAIMLINNELWFHYDYGQWKHAPIDELLDDYVEQPPFRPVAIGEVNYLYTAGEMGFTCPCGATVSIDDEPVTCTCGRLYRVRHYLEVKEAE